MGGFVASFFGAPPTPPRAALPGAGSGRDVVADVGIALCALLVCVVACALLSRRRASPLRGFACAGGCLLPPALADAVGSDSKRASELFCLKYSVLWILSVPVVIATQAYEWWGPWGYLVYCGSCAAPFVLVPALAPAPCDARLAWYQRHIFKANAWVAIFGFVGNYWYTHYFYRVLLANYTFEAHRLNDVPISMFLMTHAYFMFYHALANGALRFVRTRYERTGARFALEVSLVVFMSYATAVMEAVTIAAFPYYSFEDFYSALVYGSAFYGIYFLASFPMFFRMDERSVAAELPAPGQDSVTKERCMADDKDSPIVPSRYSLRYALVDSLGCSMLVLCALDFVRLALGVELFAPH